MDVASSPAFTQESPTPPSGTALRWLLGGSLAALVGLGVYHHRASQAAAAAVDALETEKVALSMAADRAVEERARAEQRLKVWKAEADAKVRGLEAQLAGLKAAGFGVAEPAAPKPVAVTPPVKLKMAEKRAIPDDPLGGLKGMTGR